ncbi:carbohydrate ABC transporter substrate-binding protein, CUT1 family [Streptomyces sp. ok210]|jgi:putative aldouronate transport system substrate-binding protein|nr:carbohydrate ABC transporter substrate-binding protein, CUT1 family [Streptomyces sp. ok210]
MTGMSRRTFLGLSTAVAAGAAAASLTGCGSSTGHRTEAASAKVKLPAYVPFTKVTPDLPANAKGLSAGYLSYPEQLIRSVPEVPGDGSKVTLLTEIWTQPPLPKGSNEHWQKIDQELGVDLSAILGTDPGYEEKFSATVAGGDLPDLMWIPPNQGIQHIAELLESKCADITDYVSGDAVKDYPNLAAMTPAHWKTAVVNGKIWGAPSPYPAFGQVYAGNPEVWEKAGGLSASGPDEFLAKCKEVTGGKVWALEPIYVNAVSVLSQCFGAPNKWRQNKDGSLTFWQETDEYLAALDFVLKLKQAGVFYPGDPKMADAYLKMAQGSIGAAVFANPSGGRANLRTNDPSLAAQILIPFAAGGRQPNHHYHLGTIGYTAIKKGSEKRVRMLLGVLNYLAAPFGSKERELLEFGTEGADFTYDEQGFPQRTKKGKQQVEGFYSGLATATTAPFALLPSAFPGSHGPEDVKETYAVEQKLIETAVANPTVGHYSDAYTEHYGRMSTEATDLVNDIVSGRKKTGEWKPFWTEWRSKGLDQMAREFQKSIEKNA